MIRESDLALEKHKKRKQPSSQKRAVDVYGQKQRHAERAEYGGLSWFAGAWRAPLTTTVAGTLRVPWSVTNGIARDYGG